MNETVSRAEILALRADYDRKLAALAGDVIALRQRRLRRRRIAPSLVLACMLALIPLSIRAAGSFTDLTGSVHDANIQAIHDAGITTGCVPNIRYCPTANVTRQEMASFIARTAGLGTNKAVVRAARLSVSAPTAASPSYAANELIRASQAISTYRRDTSEFALASVYNTATPLDPIVTVDITAPSGGFVVVNATIGLSIEPSSTGGAANGTVGFARLRDVSPTTTGSSSPLLSTATGNGSQATTLSPTYVFSVAAGQHAFTLEAQKAGTGTVRAFDGVITALFVPFDSTGGATTQP